MLHFGAAVASYSQYELFQMSDRWLPRDLAGVRG
jgi:hypothetical protein